MPPAGAKADDLNPDGEQPIFAHRGERPLRQAEVATGLKAVSQISAISDQ